VKLKILKDFVFAIVPVHLVMAVIHKFDYSGIRTFTESGDERGLYNAVWVTQECNLCD